MATINNTPEAIENEIRELEDKLVQAKARLRATGASSDDDTGDCITVAMHTTAHSPEQSDTEAQEDALPSQ